MTSISNSALIKCLETLINRLFTYSIKNTIKPLPGNFCEGATPDPIPNSEVKSFSADGTLS